MSRRGGVGPWFLPTGRLDRPGWWVRYVLLAAVLGLLASVLDATLWPGASPRFEDRADVADLFDVLWFFPDQGGPLTSLVALVFVVPSIAAMVTRLHDRDHSAWWLLWGLLPGIGWLVLLVTLGLLGTQDRPNRYGPPPR
jgi:uncharacterized membrane protein YhaH (DUF805 family)